MVPALLLDKLAQRELHFPEFPSLQTSGVSVGTDLVGALGDKSDATCVSFYWKKVGADAQVPLSSREHPGSGWLVGKGFLCR